MNNFTNAGNRVDEATVKISKRIIQLFSEGLYSSPNKAVEELVCNSFDAGARNVHVIISDDLGANDATIVVIDDGEGMNVSGLQAHWILGKSTRRDRSASGRKPIGKFGIGKLATYILAGCLTHVCKLGEQIHAVTMDYNSELSGDDNEQILSEKAVKLPIRKLTTAQAERALEKWLEKSGEGFDKMKLFGDDAVASWTVAILSDLKCAGKNIQQGRLQWILRTAMPLRDDFNLYFNGTLLSPSRIERIQLIKKWVIGKDIVQKHILAQAGRGFRTLPADTTRDPVHRHGLSNTILGKVTGYLELYEDELSRGKSTQIERSNGFFVYVRGRMININDAGFGLERDLLQHGTFSRMRAVAHIDDLDDDLRSSRETLNESERYALAKKFMHALFNLARNEWDSHRKKSLPQKQLSDRIAGVAPSLARKPLFSAVEKAIRGEYTLQYVSLPICPDSTSKDEAIRRIKEKFDSGQSLVSDVIKEDVGRDKRWAIYDVETGILTINLLHPFIASAQEMMTNPKNSLIFEMIMVGEILQESYLYYQGYPRNEIEDIISSKDELLTSLVRAMRHENASMVALRLMDAKNDSNGLEEAVESAFNIMGFDGVQRLGGSGEPDGVATAPLAATVECKMQHYKVGMEAKSGSKVSARTLGVPAIKRHMEKHKCDHHLVVGNGFAISKDSAMAKDIHSVTKGTKKTITLITIDDLAKLVRQVSAKCIGLDKLREMFISCVTPAETREWINEIAQQSMPDLHYKEVLEAIWKLGRKRPSEPIEYSALVNELSHLDPPIDISKAESIDICRALQSMTRNSVYARTNTVEITRRPDLILNEIRDDVQEYPDKEKQRINI